MLPLLDGGAVEAGAGDGRIADRTGADFGHFDAAGNDASCGPNTPLYGDPCGDCGMYLCDLTGALVCIDPGRNACNVCGELDESAGRLGHPCGSCGQVQCTADGLATHCVGEHTPNACGGCEPINPVDAGSPDAHLKGPPGASCSSCGSGTWRCTADLNDLACHRGRGLTACGSCERCVLYHATMDQRFGGAYLKAGTLALVEDTGTDVDVGSSEVAGTSRSLVFDPLIAGPGASGLALAYVMLSPTADPDDFNAMLMFPEFSASGDGIQSDDLRRYIVYSWMSLDEYRYVLIYDYFLETLISVGELVPGPPLAAGVDGGLEDATLTDGARQDGPIAEGGAGTDAGAGDAAHSDGTLVDTRVPDGAISDGGHDTSPDSSAALDGGLPDQNAVDTTVEDVNTTDARTEDLVLEDVPTDAN
ncbi:MAG: hypothetical protein ABIJ09_15740 [Pseudomonadota bacterium]